MEQARHQNGSHPAVGASTPCITIEKGVPIPERSNRKPFNASRYPWRQMAVGDSFLFPWTKGNLRYTYSRAQAAVRYRHLTQGEKYDVRAVDENGERVIRIWRVE
jgi:hypothetical protein